LIASEVLLRASESSFEAMNKMTYSITTIYYFNCLSYFDVDESL
jgi:hypothetical protein